MKDISKNKTHVVTKYLADDFAECLIALGERDVDGSTDFEVIALAREHRFNDEVLYEDHMDVTRMVMDVDEILKAEDKIRIAKALRKFHRVR